MVGLSSRSPNAPALLRKTARIADRLNAPWYAVYIQIPAEDLTRIDAATQRLISKHLELAQQLGGVPMTFRGPDVASTILAFAREYAIKIIVVGKSRQPWYRRLLAPLDPRTARTPGRGIRYPDRGCVIGRVQLLRRGETMTRTRPVLRDPDLPAPGRRRDGRAVRRAFLAERPLADHHRLRRLQPGRPGEILPARWSRRGRTTSCSTSGPKEKEQFIGYLSRRLRDKRLDGLVKNLFRPSYGGNRNFTLMYTLGGLMISSDDDMRPYALMEHSLESLDEGEVSRGRLHRAGQNGYVRKSFDIIGSFLDVLGKKAAEVPENYERGELLVDTAMDLETNASKGLARENSLSSSGPRCRPTRWSRWPRRSAPGPTTSMPSTSPSCS